MSGALHIVDSQVSIHQFSTELPLLGPSSFKGSRVVCRIEASNGETGFGITGRWLAEGVAAAIEHSLMPALEGVDIERLEHVHAILWRLVNARGTSRGAGLAALSCIDMAIWDVIGKTRRKSISELFGGARNVADVYVTYGFGRYDIDQLVEVGNDLVGQGFRAFKLLVGGTRGGVVEDARRVRRVREALSDDVLIALDGNESLSFDEALRLCHLTGDLDIAFFEEPIRGGDARQLRDLRHMGRVPVALGQFDGHGSRFREWLEADAIDIFQPNSMYNGGFTETRRVATLSQIYGRPLSDAGGGGLFSLHHATGFSNGGMIELHLGNMSFERAFFEGAPVPVDGRIALTGQPGIGFGLNLDAVRDTRVSE